MKRTEVNCATGTVTEVDLAAYKDAEGRPVILDAGQPSGDLIPITWEELQVLTASPPPPPIDQIRAIERTPEVSDAMQRASRLVAMAYALDDLIRIEASKGQTVTRQQAHDWAMLNDGNYKTLYDAEQAIKPLRALA